MGRTVSGRPSRGHDCERTRAGESTRGNVARWQDSDVKAFWAFVVAESHGTFSRSCSPRFSRLRPDYWCRSNFVGQSARSAAFGLIPQVSDFEAG